MRSECGEFHAEALQLRRSGCGGTLPAETDPLERFGPRNSRRPIVGPLPGEREGRAEKFAAVAARGWEIPSRRQSAYKISLWLRSSRELFRCEIRLASGFDSAGEVPLENF